MSEPGPRRRHERVLVFGAGVTGRAVAESLARRGAQVVMADDHATADHARWAEGAGVEWVGAPDATATAALVRECDLIVPAPGLPERHPLFAAAESAGTPVHGELDLAAQWDPRPCLAVTGTNGKTTVVTLATEMLRASGVRATSAGNTEVPLVAAIEDPEPEVFVVEASSFRLATATEFRPTVGTWLNFAPDHLDVHASLASYEAAKARIWRGLGADPSRLAVANGDDAVVMAHAASLPSVQTFGFATRDRTPDWGLAVDAALSTPAHEMWADPHELWSDRPFDLANVQAAAATARAGGATAEGTRQAALAFRGLPHRVELVGEADGVRYYDDSKATTPHAAMAAVRSASASKVVLIAGGRNKGIDLSELASLAPRLRVVIAIGEAGPTIARIFAAADVAVTSAASMDEAVAAAADAAQPGDAVLLSPGCASFDWYADYAARGDHFARVCRARMGVRA